ncbi:energy transducer TonB [Stutzerimonas stutzeri]|uniref:energy transducer TonB family protein n=1 Tax=Stutzerimonas stutzeri TaxID=316 RepID=UPI000F788286|nr:energy transducer TonB [Stutzerimonas stutzeri]RRW17028.1 energy transducer TonB [Stutzerimonas stutzeri]
MNFLFRSRKVLACVPAFCLLAVAIHGAVKTDLKITPQYDDSTVEIALIDQADLPPPAELIPEPIPEPEPLPPPKPEPEPEIALPEPPKPKPVPPKPVPPKPQPEPKPAPSRPQPAPAPVKAPEPRPAPVQAPAMAQTPPVNAVVLESRYVSVLRAELDKYKQYPRGREASLQRPTGNVVVWLLVDRSGRVLDSGIETKASNMLLNRAAQNSLRRIERVSPFPAQAFAGSDKYRFSATFVYNIEDK